MSHARGSKVGWLAHLSHASRRQSLRISGIQSYGQNIVSIWAIFLRNHHAAKRPIISSKSLVFSSTIVR